MFPSLKVLDGLDKDGEECLSEIDDEGEFDGEGEGDIDFIEYKDLTEEEKQALEKQGLVFADDEGEEDEEGENEDEGEGDAKAGDKRERDEDVTAGKDNKRQKVDEE